MTLNPAFFNYAFTSQEVSQLSLRLTAMFFLFKILFCGCGKIRICDWENLQKQ